MNQPTPVSYILGQCDHHGAYLGRNASNGAYGMWCDDCRSWQTKAKGYDRAWLGKDHPDVIGKIGSIPDVGIRMYRKCEGPCGQLIVCQLHHMAPRKFFGDECEQWTMVYLCTACHARWHAIVTPGLCTAYDPDRHARQLLDYLGIDNAAALTKRLINLGQALRAGAA